MADSQVPWGVDALGGTVSEPALRVRPTASDTTCPRKPQPPSPERSSNSHVKNPSNQGFDADRATECRSDPQRLRRRLELECRRGGPAGYGQARHRPAAPVDLPSPTTSRACGRPLPGAANPPSSSGIPPPIGRSARGSCLPSTSTIVSCHGHGPSRLRPAQARIFHQSVHLELICHLVAQPSWRIGPDLNYSRGRKLAAQCRAEWMICMPLGHMAESAAYW